MLEKYILEQETVTKILKKSLSENKLVQAYLFSCNNIEYIYNYAKEFSKEIISLSNLDKNTLENIYKRIDKEEYIELKIVKPDGNFIKKEQLINLQNSVMNKPVEGNKIIYIIKNCEKLNSSSANSILKFLEEPENDIIAILLTDNINLVMDTIKSRCQVLNFNNIKEKDDNNSLKNNILNLNFSKPDDEIEKLINCSFDFIETLEKKEKNTFIYIKKLLWDNFKTSEDIMVLLSVMTYLYTDAMYMKFGKELHYMQDYKEKVIFICEKNNDYDIVNKICLIEKYKNELKLNINIKMLFDKIIIELSEV